MYFSRQMWTAKPVEKLAEAATLIESFDVIGIDEGQFVSFLTIIIIILPILSSTLYDP